MLVWLMDFTQYVVWVADMYLLIETQLCLMFPGVYSPKIIIQALLKRKMHYSVYK